MRKITYRKNIKPLIDTIEYTGIHKKIDSEVQLFVYDDLYLSEYSDFNISNLKNGFDLTKTSWLNIHGLNDIEPLKTICDYFNIDNFMLDDILNTNRRTKIEEQHDLLFFNIKSLLPSQDSDTIKVEQISFLLKEGVLLSFQEKRSEFFIRVRNLIRNHSGIIRTKKADYLLYILLDTVMDNFYITIEHEEDQMEGLIDLTKKSTDPIILEKIEKHRDNFNFIKRKIIPLRDSLYDIKSIKDDDIFSAIAHENFTFFDRLYQKSLELLEQIESDMISLESASNFFFSAQNHKMNEVMKTLTVVSAIFIPLTFIVGVYGMNFENMPELKYQYGYHIIIVLLLVIVAGMLTYFKKRRWF